MAGLVGSLFALYACYTDAFLGSYCQALRGHLFPSVSLTNGWVRWILSQGAGEECALGCQSVGFKSASARTVPPPSLSMGPFLELRTVVDRATFSACLLMHPPCETGPSGGRGVCPPPSSHSQVSPALYAVVPSSVCLAGDSGSCLHSYCTLPEGTPGLPPPSLKAFLNDSMK